MIRTERDGSTHLSGSFLDLLCDYSTIAIAIKKAYPDLPDAFLKEMLKTAVDVGFNAIEKTSGVSVDYSYLADILKKMKEEDDEDTSSL